METPMFDKHALFAALRPKTTQVPIEGFGSITARQLSVREVEAIRKDLKEDDKDAFGLQLVVMSFVDDKGNRIFTKADIDELKELSNAALENLVGEALKLNGFVKDEAKNSATSAGSASA